MQVYFIMYITTVKTYLPGINVTNEELGDHINFKPKLIEKLFGNYGRHFSTNLKTGKINSKTSDLIEIILKDLFKDNNECSDDIDFIIVSTATPDFLLPTSINEACYGLGLKNIETYQIIGGCSGAVQALNLGKYILNSGLHKKGIVIGVESSNKFLNVFNNSQPLDTKEIVNYTLFGDGIGGCIVSSTSEEHSISVDHIEYNYIGMDEKVGQLVNWKGAREDLDYSPMLQEEYKIIEKRVPEITKICFDNFKEKTFPDKTNNLWFMPPQLSGKMVNVICENLNITESKILSRVDEIGNCANAAIFFQLQEFFDIALKGEKGLAISIESSRWLSAMVSVTKG